MAKTKIRWTQESWNPCTGCQEISSGCANCYAKRFAERFRNVKGHPYEQGFDFKLHPDRLEKPYSWRKPRVVFVNSMSDLFYSEVPDEFILEVFAVMEKTPQHTYQILTKRPERMVKWLSEVYKRPCPDNVWLGVTVENDSTKYRIDYLKKTSAVVKFISFEPLVGDVEITPDLLKGIDWVIVGGETGAKARQMKKEWVDEIFETCNNNLNIPFFFKHWGVYNAEGIKVGKKKAGRIYNGKIIEERPQLIK